MMWKNTFKVLSLSLILTLLLGLCVDIIFGIGIQSLMSYSALGVVTLFSLIIPKFPEHTYNSFLVIVSGAMLFALSYCAVNATQPNLLGPAVAQAFNCIIWGFCFTISSHIILNIHFNKNTRLNIICIIWLALLSGKSLSHFDSPYMSWFYFK